MARQSETLMTDLVTISGNDIDDQTARIGARYEVEDDGEHAEPWEERAYVPKRVHQSEPHVINTKTRQPAW